MGTLGGGKPRWIFHQRPVWSYGGRKRGMVGVRGDRRCEDLAPGGAVTTASSNQPDDTSPEMNRSRANVCDMDQALNHLWDDVLIRIEPAVFMMITVTPSGGIFKTDVVYPGPVLIHDQ